MVYPVLQINQDDLTSTIIITETQSNNELILGEAEDTPTLFLGLLEMFMCQYDSGYEDGYMDAIDDQDEQDEEYDIM